MWERDASICNGEGKSIRYWVPSQEQHESFYREIILTNRGEDEEGVSSAREFEGTDMVMVQQGIFDEGFYVL